MNFKKYTHKTLVGLFFSLFLFSIFIISQSPFFKSSYTSLEKVNTYQNELLSYFSKKGLAYRFESPANTLSVKTEDVSKAQSLIEEFKGKHKNQNSSKDFFSKPYFGLISSHIQKAKLQSALQKEIEGAINKSYKIKSSQVFLPSEERGNWYDKKENKNKQASVILELHDNEVISPEQIQSISFLISGSVKNLKTENVMILNSEGEVLSDPNPQFVKLVTKLKAQPKRIKQATATRKPSSYKPVLVEKANDFFILTLILTFGLSFLMGFFFHYLRQPLKTVDMVLPKTVEELEEWHSETFQKSVEKNNP